MATSAAHQHLEHALDLLATPPDRAHFKRMLERFWGFHAAWEPALGALPQFADLIARRSRLPHLAADLKALGAADAEIAALPVCDAAASLMIAPEAAIGSLYVMEGSTLGGRVISRHLEGAAWAPEGGLRYFHPYGADTGVMWRAFQSELALASSERADPLIERGAIETFDMLRQWLTQGPGMTHESAA